MIKGLFHETNRKRTIYISCHKNCKPEELAQNQGLFPPYEIKEILPDEPTEAQLNFAKDLKIKIPLDANIEDISCLLNRAVHHDSEPSPELVEYANFKKFCFSKYIGKKELYNLVFNRLDLRDRIAFFCFCIYSYLSDNKQANLEKSEHKEVFYNFADQYLNDDKFIASMNTYRGQDLRFFGKSKIIKEENGQQVEIEIYGGSRATSSYRIASKFLIETFELSPVKTKITR